MAIEKAVFVTGGTGFVGGHLINHLQKVGYNVIPCGRPGFGKIDTHIDAVVHAAGIAHRFAEETEYEAGNHATAALISQARTAGASQFVFVSSIAAQSEGVAGTTLTEESDPRPASPYGRAKLAAEELVKRGGAPFTILRPVAISGEGAKGNTGFMQKVAKLPVPVPIGSVHARRSLVSIESVCSAVETVLFNEAAIGETFIVADPEPKSAAEFIADFRKKAGRRPNIVNFPPRILKGVFGLTGRGHLWSRIDGELIADSRKLMSIGWRPAGAGVGKSSGRTSETSGNEGTSPAPEEIFTA